MIRGGKLLLAGGCLAAAACAQTQSVKIRAIADPAAKVRSSANPLGEARALLSLGDVGTALEAFRTLARQQPENPDVYAGIAASYAAMGRFDIARQNYEIALAYAPNDPALLLALAGSLDRLGEPDQAAQVRTEAARLKANAPLSASLAQSSVAPLGVPRTGSVTVVLPAPSVAKAPPSRTNQRAVAAETTRSALTREAVAPEIAPPDRALRPVSLASAAMAPQKVELAVNVPMSALEPLESAPPPEVMIAPPQLTSAEVKLSSAPLAPKTAQPTHVEWVAISQPVQLPETGAPEIDPPRATKAAVKLAALPFAPNTAELAATALQSLAAPVVTSVPSPPAPAVAPGEPRRELAEAAQQSGPHLERMSTGEVSLVTQPVTHIPHSWPKLPQMALPTQSEMVKASAPIQSAPKLAAVSPLRWVPLKYASAPVNIELLNAGRIQNLAAHARVALLDRGWHKIGIGNARFVRQRTVVLYTPNRARIARRLAADFRCKSRKVEGIRGVIVLLGRDATFGRRFSARA